MTSLLLPGIKEKLPFLAMPLLFDFDAVFAGVVSEGEISCAWGDALLDSEEDTVGEAVVAFLELLLRRNLL